MLRTFVCGLLPLAVAAALAAAAFALANHANEKLVSETTADRDWVFASLPPALAFFVAHLLVDAARAQFAAALAAGRALLALWTALRLFARRPLRVLLIGLVGGVGAVVPAALFMLLRLQLTQVVRRPGRPCLVARPGSAARVGFGRNTRIFALAELHGQTRPSAAAHRCRSRVRRGPSRLRRPSNRWSSRPCRRGRSCYLTAPHAGSLRPEID